MNVSQGVQPRKTSYRFSRGYKTKAWNHATVSKSRYKLDAELPIDVKVDTTATTTCFEPDTELPMDVKVDTTATTTRFEQDAELHMDVELDIQPPPHDLSQMPSYLVTTRWTSFPLN